MGQKLQDVRGKVRHIVIPCGCINTHAFVFYMDDSTLWTKTNSMKAVYQYSSQLFSWAPEETLARVDNEGSSSVGVFIYILAATGLVFNPICVSVL